MTYISKTRGLLTKTFIHHKTQILNALISSFSSFPGMNFQVLVMSPLLLIFIFFLTTNIPPSLSLTQYFSACSWPFKCGDLTAYPPFWDGDSPQPCGLPELRLKCEDHNISTININGVKYRVLNITETSQTLRISRADYQNVFCDLRFPNTTMLPPLLDYYNHFNIKTITFLYDCPSFPESTASPESLAWSPEESMMKINCPYHEHACVMKTNSSCPEECKRYVTVPIEKHFISLGLENSSVLDQALKQGFEVKWNSFSEWDKRCEECMKSNGSCAFDHEKRKPLCYCLNQAAVLDTTCSVLAPTVMLAAGHRKRTFKISISISLGVTAGITILVCILLIFQRRKLKLHKLLCSSEKQNQLQDNQMIEDFMRSYGYLGPQRYSYHDIKMMTDFFSIKLGQGGFGDVYKGELCDGRHVAVKLLDESKGNGEEFINEVASISRTSHVNVVTLLGFCFEKKKRGLVYEFMPNGSLDKYIYGQVSCISTNQLGWNSLYRIGVGIARGLEYLHSGCNTRIVHFDIKPHNILLDEDFCPKISDFGLSKLCKRKESIMSMLGGRGTPGYIAPEVFNRNFGEVSHKSDVYSYGMMIIEMVGGRKNMDARGSQESEIYFQDWIYKYTEPENELHGAITEEEKELAKKMILVSLWCIQAIPSDRPSINKVVEMLEGRVEDLQVPPKPSLCSPVRSIKWSSQTSTTMS